MPIRQAVLDELTRRHRSRYWLAKQLDGQINRGSIYKWLQGSQSLGEAKIDIILAVLDLDVRPERWK